MAKKKLILNEGATRRFMKLASVKPAYVSNFLKEAEDMMGMEDEDEAPVGDEEAELAPMEDEAPMDAEMEMEPELTECTKKLKKIWTLQALKL